MEKWNAANREALQQYGDGHHFLRTLVEKDGKKSMVEAIRMAEESWQNHCSVALAYNRLQDAENALKYFQQAYNLDPSNTDILHAIGVTHYNLQNYERARDVLAEFLKSDPQNPEAQEILQACNNKLKPS
jgi:Tfp pilus assembly protein PilF